jgi:hypothetical protein
VEIFVTVVNIVMGILGFFAIFFVVYSLTSMEKSLKRIAEKINPKE